MNKKGLEKIAKVIHYTRIFFDYILGVIFVVLVGGMIIDMVKNLQLNNFHYFLENAQLSLTLFGFTFVGYIFEKNKEDRLIKKVIKHLFIISIIFLFSSISFIGLNSLAYLGTFSGLMYSIYQILVFMFLCGGFFGLVGGILYLLTILLEYLEYFIKL